jgi:hypothetical protein
MKRRLGFVGRNVLVRAAWLEANDLVVPAPEQRPTRGRPRQKQEPQETDSGHPPDDDATTHQPLCLSAIENGVNLTSRLLD